MSISGHHTTDSKLIIEDYREVAIIRATSFVEQLSNQAHLSFDVLLLSSGTHYLQ